MSVLEIQTLASPEVSTADNWVMVQTDMTLKMLKRPLPIGWTWQFWSPSGVLN